MLEELVEHDLRDRVALQLDLDPHPRLVRVVGEVGDLRDHLVVDQVGDLLDHPGVAALLDPVRQLGDDDRALSAAELLDVGASAHHDPAPARPVGVADPAATDDDRAGREVGALHVLHQVLDVRVGLVDQLHDRVDRLTEMMGRDVRRHADRDARGAVHEEVREARRKRERLLARLVVVRPERDGVHVDVAEHLRGETLEPALRVPHRRRRVVVDRAEVALPVDERVPQRERLRHPHEGVVDRRVAVRVVVAHDVADDVRRLLVRPVRLHAGLVHAPQHAPVHRLEPVAHVGQRAADDHAHRVVEVARAHLLLELARLDAPRPERLGHIRHRGT